MAQESEAKESFEQLEMLQRTHDKLRSRADGLEAVHDRLFSQLEIVKKTLLVRKDHSEARASNSDCLHDISSIARNGSFSVRTPDASQGSQMSENPVLINPVIFLVNVLREAPRSNIRTRQNTRPAFPFCSLHHWDR